MPTPVIESQRPTKLEYYVGLDGLRGLGLIPLLLYHAGVTWIPGGYLTVSMFFTLSGFLITSLLLYEMENTGRIDVRAFWVRRLRRLMPGALAALAVIAILGATIGDTSQIIRLRGDGIAALFYVSNWRFIYLGSEYVDLFSSPSLVQHFWSLSIEEQFYLTFPIAAILCLKFVGRRGFGLIIGALALLSTLWMAYSFEPDIPTSRLYYGTDTRIAEILVGVLLAVWHAGRLPLQGAARRAAVSLGTLGLIGTIVFWFTVPLEAAWLWQGGFLLYACVTAATILGMVQSSGPVIAILSWGPLPWLGRLSYGVYLYHYPVYVTLTESFTGLDFWPLFAVRIAITFALAVPSLYLLERPVRRGTLITGWRPWLFMPAGFASVALMLIVATIDPPKPAVDLTETSQAERLLERDEGPRIMVVGGSVAHGVGGGLKRWAKKTQKASIFNVARFGCGIARGGRPMNVDQRKSAKCDNWPEYWEGALEMFEPDVVVVLVGGWDFTDGREFPAWGKSLTIGDEAYDAWLQSEYEAAVELLTSRGARVIWLSTPCYEPRNGGRGLYDPRRPHALNAVLQRLDDKLGDEFELYDFFSRVCPEGEYVETMFGGERLRPDGVHFSARGDDWIASWLSAHILTRYYASDSN